MLVCFLDDNITSLNPLEVQLMSFLKIFPVSSHITQV